MLLGEWPTLVLLEGFVTTTRWLMLEDMQSIPLRAVHMMIDMRIGELLMTFYW